MWATGQIVCSPVYRLLTVCCPIQRVPPNSQNRYYPTREKTIDLGNGLPAFTSKTHTVQPGASSFDEPVEENFGRIYFKLDYDFSQSKLSVAIVECRNLPPMDRNGKSDPYVKLSILPERKQKFETKIIRNTLNPVYNETFLFSIPFNELQSKSLLMVVFDYDRLSKDDKMGQIVVPLDSIDFGQTTDLDRALCRPERDDDKDCRLGDICFSTRYRPATGTITLTIMEARNLKKMDVGGSSGRQL
ncbi:hypothetical protein WR25_07586 isoform B [Diploscapter pachys]|uniref:C2 domain-containing protein n=1 Tax=Diploscapter pachys TaxID=2018661 RepID=A0A2A2LQP3_9BILA|nr:hypothetical protein WR25_07586 isoform A [Diploscapter pachys]PAV88346.1 hypothetical protein WR25_07586 isoform B [Diploscapter pachys]